MFDNSLQLSHNKELNDVYLFDRGRSFVNQRRLQSVGRKNIVRRAKMQDKKVYETPEVVYEGNISTRAGSPPTRGGQFDDPADLFDNE